MLNLVELNTRLYVVLSAYLIYFCPECLASLQSTLGFALEICCTTYSDRSMGFSRGQIDIGQLPVSTVMQSGFVIDTSTPPRLPLVCLPLFLE